MDNEENKKLNLTNFIDYTSVFNNDSPLTPCDCCGETDYPKGCDFKNNNNDCWFTREVKKKYKKEN